VTARLAKRENGGLGGDPPGRAMTYFGLDVQASDNAPSEARKRESRERAIFIFYFKRSRIFIQV
jgi:hypothetical protein